MEDTICGTKKWENHNQNQNEKLKDSNLFEYALMIAKKYDQINNLN